MSPTSYQLLHPAMYFGFLEKEPAIATGSFCSSGDQTRTSDLRVMSPTSYQLLHPAMYFECLEKNRPLQPALSVVAGTRLELVTFGL